MNMKQKCHFKQIILLFALGLFIFSCKNPLAQSQENQLSKETVKLKISTDLARTVLPTQFNEETLGLTWTLTGIKDGVSQRLDTWSDDDTGAVSKFAYSKMTSTEISVDVGTWNFTLDVTNSSDEKVLTGTTGSIDVSTSSTLTFVMQEPTGEGVAQGQIEFTLTFPAGVVGNVEATLTEYGKTNEQVNPQPFTPQPGETEDSVTYTNTVSAGTYMLKLDLQQKDPADTVQYKTINTYTCLIRVAPGLCSTGTETLDSLAKLYKIKYELDNGTIPGNVTPTSYNQYTKFELPNPTKQGYIFLGWCTDEKCLSESCEQLQAAGTTISISQDTTLYAKWQKVSIPSITLDIKENGNPNNSSPIQKTDCIGISVAPNSDSESVWTYFGTVSPSSADQGYTFQKGDNKVSIQMKATEKTVVAIAAARADMFFTVDTEWKTFEFNTGYLNEELTKAITIGVGLSKEVYFRNITVTQTQTATEKTINNTLPTLSFDINKTGIQEYLSSENSNPIIQVSQEEAGYSIVVQASANNFDLSIRSYATPSQLNKVNFTLQNVSDENLTSSLLGFSVNGNEENNSSNVNYWSTKVNYNENNNIVFPAFSNGDSSDLVPCVIQGIVDTGSDNSSSLTFSLLNFSSSSIESLEDTRKVFAIKTGSDDNENWQQKTKLDEFSLEIASLNKSVLQVVITDAFKGEELDWDSNSYYCQFSNYKADPNSSSLIDLANDTDNSFTTITNNSSSKIRCKAQIDSNFNVVISATEVQPAIPESGLALEIGSIGTEDVLHVYNEIGLENIKKLVNGEYVTIGIYESNSNEIDYTYLNGQIVLENDIELTSSEWTPIGTDSNPFVGIFDGNKKTVSGIVINTESENVGFFYATEDSTIKDLIIEGNIEFRGSSTNSYIGGFAGYSKNTSYINCINNVKITYENYGYSYIGGLVGQINNCNFNNCINLAEISVSENVGGIVGIGEDNSSNQFEKCINLGSLIALKYAGGIIGYNSDCGYTIKNCLNLADIGNEDETATQLSGIIGPGDSSINGSQEVSYCLNLGKLKGRAHFYPITSYEKSADEKNYYDCTKNPSVDEEYGAVGKETSDLKIGNSFDESWSTENWSFENGRYPLPDISQNIPRDVWATVLEKAK
mgnify:CR=1 FL=1